MDEANPSKKETPAAEKTIVVKTKQYPVNAEDAAQKKTADADPAKKKAEENASNWNADDEARKKMAEEAAAKKKAEAKSPQLSAIH